jgi:multimeric flavodoxin WrbA
MKITTILGSPHKHGNTEAVLSQFESLACAAHQVQRINITDVDIKGCLGCDSCFKKIDQPGCCQRDDFQQVVAHILQADLVIYAAPVYVWNFPAQLKALFDRHYCLVKWQEGKVTAALLRGKPAALLLTCGGDAAGNLDLVEKAFEREIEYLQAQVKGMYALADCASREDALQRGEAVASRMAQELLNPRL